MELLDLVRQYAAVKQMLNDVSDREKKLKEELKSIVLESGELDEKGSTSLEVDDEISKVRKLVQQRRVSKSFDPNAAESILKEKGLFDRCIEMVPALDEQEILAARYEDLLTDDDIDAMFPAKESFAFMVVIDK